LRKVPRISGRSGGKGQIVRAQTKKKGTFTIRRTGGERGSILNLKTWGKRVEHPARRIKKSKQSEETSLKGGKKQCSGTITLKKDRTRDPALATPKKKEGVDLKKKKKLIGAVPAPRSSGKKGVFNKTVSKTTQTVFRNALPETFKPEMKKQKKDAGRLHITSENGSR